MYQSFTANIAVKTLFVAHAKWLFAHKIQLTNIPYIALGLLYNSHSNWGTTNWASATFLLNLRNTRRQKRWCPHGTSASRGSRFSSIQTSQKLSGSASDGVADGYVGWSRIFKSALLAFVLYLSNLVWVSWGALQADTGELWPTESTTTWLYR